MSRRTLATVLGTLILAVIVTLPASAQRPIKIGFMAGLTGPAPQVGKDMLDGFKMYLDDHGMQIGGRKVELIVEDNQARPDMAANKLRKLVESDNVDLLRTALGRVPRPARVRPCVHAARRVRQRLEPAP